MDEIKKYPHCFVCGEKNINGLQATFLYDGNQAITEVTARKDFEGYKGVYHGGILSTLLDEVMIKSILAEDIIAVTAEMTIKFKHPVSTGDKLRLTGRVVSRKGRLLNTVGEAVGPEGRVYATATGKYLEVRPPFKNQLMQSLGTD